MTDEIIISDNPEDTTCPAIGYQQLSVCVPVKVTPFAKAGKTVTTCCGSPAVISGRTSCGGTQQRFLLIHHQPNTLCCCSCRIWCNRSCGRNFC